jgi:hypothetical protein
MAHRPERHAAHLRHREACRCSPIPYPADTRLKRGSEASENSPLRRANATMSVKCEQPARTPPFERLQHSILADSVAIFVAAPRLRSARASRCSDDFKLFGKRRIRIGGVPRLPFAHQNQTFWWARREHVGSRISGSYRSVHQPTSLVLCRLVRRTRRRRGIALIITVLTYEAGGQRFDGNVCVVGCGGSQLLIPTFASTWASSRQEPEADLPEAILLPESGRSAEPAA